MKLGVEQGDITSVSPEAIIVNLFEGATAPDGAAAAVDRAMDGAITSLISAGDVTGKLGELTLIYSFGQLPAPRGPQAVLETGSQVHRCRAYALDTLGKPQPEEGRVVGYKRLEVNSL